MPLRDDGFLTSRNIPSLTDAAIRQLNPWRKAASGTTSAAIVIPCPTYVSGQRKPQIAVITLYAMAVGGTPTCTITSGTDDIVEFALPVGYPVTINFGSSPFTIEPEEDLTITVAGASSTICSVMATGSVWR